MVLAADVREGWTGASKIKHRVLRAFGSSGTIQTTAVVHRLFDARTYLPIPSGVHSVKNAVCRSVETYMLA